MRRRILASSLAFFSDVRNVERWFEGREDATTLPRCALGDNFVYSGELDGAIIRGAENYCAAASRWHSDGTALLGDGSYRTSVLGRPIASAGSSDRVTVRWRAEWIPDSSSWLVSLADAARWSVRHVDPDPRTPTAFRWGAVRDLFVRAAASGVLDVPRASVQGRTELDFDPRTGRCVRHRERLDPVSDADAGRLVNRRAARAAAEFCDLRRPTDVDPDAWAVAVRSRVLDGVPGMGTLDIEPMDGEESGVGALFVAGSLVVVAVAAVVTILADQATVWGGAGAGICDGIGTPGDILNLQCLSDAYE